MGVLDRKNRQGGWIFFVENFETFLGPLQCASWQSIHTYVVHILSSVLYEQCAETEKTSLLLRKNEIIL